MKFNQRNRQQQGLKNLWRVHYFSPGEEIFRIESLKNPLEDSIENKLFLPSQAKNMHAINAHRIPAAVLKIKAKL